MICTEDEEFYPVGHEWNFQGCNVKLLEVSHNGTYIIVCDINVDDQTYPEQMLQDGTTYTYGAYTVTCRGFIGTDGTTILAQTTICAEPEANQIITLYFRPYPWSSNSSAISLLTSKAVELAGGLANAFSSISGYEYISHDVVIERPEFSQIDLVAIRIYVYSTESPTPQFIFTLTAILLVIALFGGSFAYVGSKWQDIMATWTYKYPATVRECNTLYSDNVELRIENGCDRVNNGEMTVEEFIVLLHDIVKENHAHRNMISPKNSQLADDNFELNIENAIAQYNIDGNFDALCAAATNTAQTRSEEDATETEKNYKPGVLPDLSGDANEWLTYLMYGGMAVGGIILVTLGIQLIDTININR